MHIHISIPYGSIKRPGIVHSAAINHISIPYGSIKSRMAGTSVYRTGISIPYGSIKSGLLYRGALRFLIFQFLMVRLKAAMMINENFGS